MRFRQSFLFIEYRLNKKEPIISFRRFDGDGKIEQKCKEGPII